METTTKKIGIINGPNLNLLGNREPAVYGSKSFEEYLEALQGQFVGYEIDYFQSNHEGLLIDKLHEWADEKEGIIINAGAYSHTSIAIADAIGAIHTPVIEVHISNIYKRESYRHHSYLSAKCVGKIVGLGLEGYKLALYYFK
ncbi:MAG: type II 3-dehydroquinate dehydratase [Saprospiraceae bacterium]|nr:type II 3-dehydroquinate dehydratase [Saprospiraceae bacterium]MBP7644319.1 type II 3-dehydroquinate dehydratase [Saprospiraceae bacterium]